MLRDALGGTLRAARYSFFTMLCLLMLKLNLAGELLNDKFFDTVAVTSNILAVVLPLGISAGLSLRRLANEWLDSSQDPPQAGDVVRVLESPADPRCQGRLGKVTAVTESDALDSSEPVTLILVVNLRTTADRVKAILLCRCRAPEKVTLTLDRGQAVRLV